MCFNLHEELQAILYCAQPQTSWLTNRGMLFFLYIYSHNKFLWTFCCFCTFWITYGESQCWLWGLGWVVYSNVKIVRIPNCQLSLLCWLSISLETLWQLVFQYHDDISESKSRESQEVYFPATFPFRGLTPFNLDLCLDNSNAERECVLISHPLRIKERGESGVQYVIEGYAIQWPPLCLHMAPRPKISTIYAKCHLSLNRLDFWGHLLSNLLYNTVIYLPGEKYESASR